MEHAKGPEFETTVFDVNTEILIPPIIQIWGSYAYKWNITAQWLNSPNWDVVHIRQEWKKAVVEYKTKITTTYDHIISYQGKRFVAEDFHSVVDTLVQLWFSPYGEPYNKFRYAYASKKNPQIWKVRFNFDTYEIGWKKHPIVLKIVAKTEEAVIRVTSLLDLDESKLHWIEPIDIYNQLNQENTR